MKKIRISLILLLGLLLLPALCAGEEEPALRITPPQGREDAQGYLTDGNAETRLTLERQKSVLVEWDVKDAASLLISWYESAPKVLIEVLDESGAVANRATVQNTPYRQHVNVTCGNSVRITALTGFASIAELRLFRVGEALPFAETDPHEADLLVICAGAIDECRLLGGLIPYYAGEHDVSTAVVYIRTDYGYVTNESFAALAALGYTEYPVFMNRNDQNVSQEEKIKILWGKTLMGDLWQIIRKVNPKVIVTLDPGDKSQPARTRIAAKIVRDTVQSYTRKIDIPLEKLYVLSSGGKTVLDWKTPLNAFGGKTAYEVACGGLEAYTSQRMYKYSCPDTGRFELVYTKVGEDTVGNDLFENIDTGKLKSYRSAAPLTLPEPGEDSSGAPVAGLLSDLGGPKSGGTGLLALGALCVMLGSLMKKKRGLAACMLAFALVFCGNIAVRADEEQPTEAPLQEEAALPEAEAVPEAPVETEEAPAEETPAETEETPAEEAPTAAEEAPAEEAPAPEQKPSPSDDIYYRQPGEPEEVIVSDYPGGHWEYRSDTLSVIIDREIFTLDNHPQCIYVAYIRSRDVDCFHCGLASTSGSDGLIMPWRLARTYKAVLAITGDNLVNAEKTVKGILIRNGVFYSDCQGEDTLVVYSSQNIGLVKKGTISGLQLLDSGVRNAYSFGPVLVENGEVNPDVSKHRVARGNPRCGIGIIEEGCLVAICADGRDPNRAFNLTLDEFAQIFKDKGVRFAYNLDGGASEAMVFMGESVTCHSDKGGQRTWIDALMWGYSDKVPSTGAPVEHYGEGKGYY